MADLAKKRLQARVARHARIREKISGTAECPRLTVRRTLKNMVVQIVDDVAGSSLLQMTTSSKDFQTQHGSLNKREQCVKLGELVAVAAKSRGIEKVVFDRGGYIYHGRVQALAQSIRDNGLNF